jgi:hypothetical protein
MSSQHKGVAYRPTASQGGVSSTLDNESTRATTPNSNQLKISYGQIIEVHDERSTIDVMIFGKPGDILNEFKVFEVPLIHPLQFYHLVFGQIRKGLVVRLFWRGSSKPGRESFAEIIDNSDGARFKSGKKKYENNTQTTGPWKIFSGGLG